jgi:hypothetical protein
MDRHLQFWEKTGLRIHLMMCRKCTQFRNYILKLKELTQREGPALFETEEEKLSDEGHSRILDAVHNQITSGEAENQSQKPT